MASAAMVLGAVAPASAASPAVANTTGRLTHFTVAGTTRLRALTTHGPLLNVKPATSAVGTEVSPIDDIAERSPKVEVTAANPPTTPPAVAGRSVTYANPSAKGFNGLSHLDSRSASGGNQFSLEPPDQGLCVGNGFVIETINDVMAVYHTNGTLAAGPTALNAFLGYAPSFDRTNIVFGPFVTDPKCYYDRDTQRFYHTALTFDVDPATGNDTGTSHVDVAVSQTSDPTGAWTLFHLDTTNGDGSLVNHPGCPCFGDQPLLGFDANGMYLSTNEFPVFAAGFNGAQIYATSKWLLSAAASVGTAPGAVVAFDGLPLAEGQAYSVQPADAPGGYATGHNGTEFFLSALQFGPAPLDNRIAIWSLTNTKSLARVNPSLKLQSHVMRSEVYGQPNPAAQRNGLLTLNTSLTLINSNDDRMNQVVYSNGLLWSGVNTIVTTRDGSTRVGIAYFAVQPDWNGSKLGGNVQHQGYVAVNGQNVLYPAIGLDANGHAVMSFTLVGPRYYPSSAYLRLDDSWTSSTVHVIGVGVGPADGFTGDPAFGGVDHVERWGDYGAAVSDNAGHIWIASEYIPGGTRTALANWGTFISSVTP